VALSIAPQKSPHNGIPFCEIPIVKGSMYGNAITVVSARDYGCLLDCLLEMSIDVTDGNGVSAAEGVRVTLATEFFNVWDTPCSPDWSKKILPKHARAVTAIIAARSR